MLLLEISNTQNLSSKLKDTEATLTKDFAKNSNTLFFLQYSLPTLPKIML